LLAVPALRALRRQGRRVTLAAHGPTARFLAGLGEVEVGLAFDDPSLGWVFGGAAPPDPLPRVVAWLEARLAIQPEVQAPSRPSDERTHCARYLLESIGADDLDAHALAITPIASEEVLVHPGSGSPRKNWPPGLFATVIKELASPVRLIVGEADALAASAVEQCLGRRLPRLEHPPLEELAARLAGCRAYLGNDSGVSHLAGLAGARSVVLFGPTPEAVWRPLGPRVSVMHFSARPAEVLAALR
jgi:Glycosyltransferase family 9 (heptosyltransferase)